MNHVSTLAVALILFLTSLSGCAEHGTQPTGGTSRVPANSPLVVSLTLDAPEALYQDGVEIAFRAQVSKGSEEIKAGVALPPGTTLLSGALAYEGVVEAGKPLLLRGIVRAEQPGEHAFRGWAELMGWANGGGRAAPSDLLGVRGDAQEAETFEPVPRLPDYHLDLTADPDDSSRLLAQVTSPIDMDSARILLTLPPPPNGMALEAGKKEWEGPLQAGQAWNAAYKVQFLADGTYIARLHFYPEAAIDGRVLEAAVAFTVEDGQAHVQDDP